MPPRNARSLRSQRFYQWGAERFWSVTTIIGGGIPKPALKSWGERVVAQGAVDAQRAGTLARMVKQDPDAAVEYLRKLPYGTTKRSADLGTRVHEAIEAATLGKPMPKPQPDEVKRLEAFAQFVEAYRPEFIASEATVYSRTHAYAGTFDAIVLLDGKPYMLDVKTGKNVYPEVGLQLAAYRRAEFIGLPDGTEAPVPETVGGVCLHLPESGEFDLLDVDTSDRVFAAFVYAREVHRYMDDISKTVVRAPHPYPPADAETLDAVEAEEPAGIGTEHDDGTPEPDDEPRALTVDEAERQFAAVDESHAADNTEGGTGDV